MGSNVTHLEAAEKTGLGETFSKQVIEPPQVALEACGVCTISEDRLLLVVGNRSTRVLNTAIKCVRTHSESEFLLKAGYTIPTSMMNEIAMWRNNGLRHTIQYERIANTTLFVGHDPGGSGSHSPSGVDI